MSLRVGTITFDCENPQEVARFWAAALDLSVDVAASEFFVSLAMSDAATSPAVIHVADKGERGHAWSVLHDVEGNEFCIG